ALSKLFKYPPVPESRGEFPDTQTDQLASRLRAFSISKGKDVVTILDLGAGVGRQIAELRKVSNWQLGAEVQWTCFEPIESNRRELEKIFGNLADITIVDKTSSLENVRFDLCLISNVL